MLQQHRWKENLNSIGNLLWTFRSKIWWPLSPHYPMPKWIYSKLHRHQWRTEEKFSGGSRLWPASEGVRRADPSGRRRIFEIFQKDFLRKLQKMHYFSIFFKKFNKPCVNFSRVWTKKTNSWEILNNFRKFSKHFFRKFRKIHYFSIFFEKLTNHVMSYSFARLDEKHWLLGNFEKFLKCFKMFLKEIANAFF